MLYRTAAALFLTFTITAGCSMTHSDSENPKKNPHPVKRYEVTATTDSPGPWDEVSGRVYLDVINVECTPENKFLGVHVKPTQVAIDFRMDRMSEKAWKGSFYQDAMLDEDYYGLGICHWDPTSVSTALTAKGVSFSSGSLFEYFLKKGPQTEFFKKSSYGDASLVRYGAQNYSHNDPDVIKYPDAYFQITVTVKEVTP